MTAPATEKNPAAVETAGLEIAVQRQREGSADPSKREPTTAAGAVEKTAPIPAEERLWWFLFVLNACGDHGSYANDDPGEWVAAFCDDVEPTDTFNRACDLKLATCTHNSMDETSRVWITEAGKRFLADRASQEERIREDERDRLYAKAREDRDRSWPDPRAWDACEWLSEEGAMHPIDRARQRGDAS